jgi:hypothetical protein
VRSFLYQWVVVSTCSARRSGECSWKLHDSLWSAHDGSVRHTTTSAGALAMTLVLVESPLLISIPNAQTAPTTLSMENRREGVPLFLWLYRVRRVASPCRGFCYGDLSGQLIALSLVLRRGAERCIGWLYGDIRYT